MIEKIKELCKWIDETISIAENFQVSPGIRYELVFGAYKKHVALLAKELNLSLDWYDPDTTYEEDIHAYVCCIKELREQLDSIIES